MKLTRTQERVMEWLRGGHYAYRQYGTVVYANGTKLCREETMRSLQRKGLVVQVDDCGWMATEKGKR